MDEKRTDTARPLVRVSALCFFSALTLTIEWLVGHPAAKKTCIVNFQRFFM